MQEDLIEKLDIHVYLRDKLLELWIKEWIELCADLVLNLLFLE
jgi:hypothetical protein